MDKKTEYLLQLAEDAEYQGRECDGTWIKDAIIGILAGRPYRKVKD